MSKCKPYNTSEANAKSFLRTKGAIDQFLNIIDLNKFRNLHSELKEQAKQYLPDFSDKLFFEQNGGKKAIPNTSVFQQIDKAKGIYYSLKPENEINYTLKSVDILQSQKGIETFNKGIKNNWSLDKILTELQIPKEQKALILSFNTNNREEILTSLLANYSFTVEINTAKNKIGSDIYGRGYEPKQITDKDFAQSLGAEVGDYFVEYITEDGDPDLRTFKTLEEANNAFQTQRSVDNSSVYSNLTVPGGTNYTENEIATPLITPSIKGHAQFSTDKGIGWGRWDEQQKDSSKPDVILPIGTSGSGKSTFIKSLPQENLVIIEPDTMRVEFTGDINDKSKDKEIYEEAANRAIQAIKQGKQVVFDTTNLTKDKRLPFIEAIKKEIPTANIQYRLMELNPELAKQRIKAQIARGENRANVPDTTIDRHAESYKQMLEDIKNEPITPFVNRTESKTRRILEVQSDWGQKQRKSSEPDINVKYDIQQIINDLQKSGDLKINCN